MSIPSLVGRSSSHYTRLARLFALELGVAVEFVPVFDLASRDAADYAGNPALKLPVLRIGDTAAFGAENICRTLADRIENADVIWTEQLGSVTGRNAQELTWHAMQAQVQLVFGTQAAGLPADNVYFSKAASGLGSALAWLDGHLDAVLDALPPRRISLLEGSLFCLLEHLVFRPTVPFDTCPRLVAFAEAFRQRSSAQATTYHVDVKPN
jgi:glutathione S-transferase